MHLSTAVFIFKHERYFFEGYIMGDLSLRLRKKIKKFPLITKVLRGIAFFLRKRSFRKTLARLSKDYRALTEKYNEPGILAAKTEQPPFDGEAYPVWVCWFQGEENMPDVIKMCYDSLLQNANGHKVTLITKDNYLEYTGIPEYICEKHRKGIITHTHFSDIIRMNLLSRYGGLWIDATFFVSKKLPSFGDSPLWTTKWVDNRDLYREMEFTVGLLYCRPNNPIPCFVKECFDKYWLENNKLVIYLLVSAFVKLACEKIKPAGDFMNNVPVSQIGIHRMYLLMNSEYNADEYNYVTDAIFHKLSYKDDFSERTKNGKLTLYGHLMREWRSKKTGFHGGKI